MISQRSQVVNPGFRSIVLIVICASAGPVLADQPALATKLLGASFNTTFPLSAPGVPIHLDYRSSPFVTPLTTTKVHITFQNQIGFSSLNMRLSDGTVLAVAPLNSTEGIFNWYDPAVHTAAEFSSPSALLPTSLFNELQDGVLDAGVWVNAANTGSGFASIGVSVEAYTPEPSAMGWIAGLLSMCGRRRKPPRRW
jgi:hypothetical protein